MRFLCVGDVVARPGREILHKLLPLLREEYEVDFVIVNGENSAGGSGIDLKCYREIVKAGADVVTLGDHTWRRSEVATLLKGDDFACICPGNYPVGETVVRGWIVREIRGVPVAVINVLGRTFMSGALDCPFRYVESLLSNELVDVPVRIVDIHAEATSEKIAFAAHFDGQLTAVFGTHTHVATADARILPGGTAAITDVGMTGSQAGVIGMDAKAAIDRFLTGLPSGYRPAKGDEKMHAILVELDSETLRPKAIEQIIRSSQDVPLKT
jgi:metallophosphoesterase (TIGR00282 family)